MTSLFRIEPMRKSVPETLTLDSIDLPAPGCLSTWLHSKEQFYHERNHAVKFF